MIYLVTRKTTGINKSNDIRPFLGTPTLPSSPFWCVQCTHAGRTPTLLYLLQQSSSSGEVPRRWGLLADAYALPAAFAALSHCLFERQRGNRKGLDEQAIKRCIDGRPDGYGSRRQLEMLGRTRTALAVVNTSKSYLLVALSARGLFVFAQGHQELAEALLARPGCAALDALAGDVDDLGDPLPAGAAGCDVVAVAEELLGILAALADQLVLLVVVVLVKVVNVALCLGDGLLALLCKLLRTLGVLLVALRPPGLEDLGLLLVLDSCIVAGLEVDRRAGDGSWCGLQVSHDPIKYRQRKEKTYLVLCGKVREAALELCGLGVAAS